MPLTHNSNVTGGQLATTIRGFIVGWPEGTPEIKPGHRTPFHWPPHPISHKYHVVKSDWTGSATFECLGETCEAEIARTPNGVFGRSVRYFSEAKGDTEETMLQGLSEATKPLLERQALIGQCIGTNARYEGSIRDLPPHSLLRLLYCPDRDVAYEAMVEIETHRDPHLFTLALIEILNDRRQPHRASAQWCVLDLFEDLSFFCTNHTEEQAAVQAMKGLLMNAEHDYARSVYKAGVVLGGHLPGEVGGPVLIECLHSPSRIGRRSAMHGLFHVVEWEPSMRSAVVDALAAAAEVESDPLLREFAKCQARDIAKGMHDHVLEPVFEGE